MKITKIRKGQELSASQMLSNRTDSDFREIDENLQTFSPLCLLPAGT